MCIAILFCPHLHYAPSPAPLLHPIPPTSTAPFPTSAFGLKFWLDPCLRVREFGSTLFVPHPMEVNSASPIGSPLSGTGLPGQGRGGPEGRGRGDPPCPVGAGGAPRAPGASLAARSARLRGAAPPGGGGLPGGKLFRVSGRVGVNFVVRTLALSAQTQLLSRSELLVVSVGVGAWCPTQPFCALPLCALPLCALLLRILPRSSLLLLCALLLCALLLCCADSYSPWWQPCSS